MVFPFLCPKMNINHLIILVRYRILLCNSFAQNIKQYSSASWQQKLQIPSVTHSTSTRVVPAKMENAGLNSVTYIYTRYGMLLYKHHVIIYHIRKGRSEGECRTRDPSVCVHAMDSRACVTFVLFFIAKGAALKNGESRK